MGYIVFFLKIVQLRQDRMCTPQCSLFLFPMVSSTAPGQVNMIWSKTIGDLEIMKFTKHGQVRTRRNDQW